MQALVKIHFGKDWPVLAQVASSCVAGEVARVKLL